MVTDDISFFFDPKSIAIIGASNQKGSVGKALFENALRSGKNRKIYPVSIKRKKIGAKKKPSKKIGAISQ